MKLDTIRTLWRTLSADPTSSQDLRLFGSLAKRALAWMALHELLRTLQFLPIKIFIDLATTSGSNFWGQDKRMFVGLFALGALVLNNTESWVFRRMDSCRLHASFVFFAVLNDFGNRKQLSLSADWHTQNSTGDKESVLGKNHKKVDVLIDYLIFSVIPLATRAIIITVVMWFIAWPLGIVATLTVGLYLHKVVSSEPTLQPLRKQHRDYTRRLERSDSELAGNALTIKEQGLEHEMAADHRRLVFGLVANVMEREPIFQREQRRRDRVVNYSRAIAWPVGFLAISQGLPLSSIVLGIAWLERIYSNLWEYSEFQRPLVEGSEALKELVKLFTTQPTIQPPAVSRRPTTVRGQIELDRVSFGYPGTSQLAIDDISLRIEPGQTVALVGPSGGGKSTLAKLIMHQYEPTSGRILVDGVDLTEMDDWHYRYEILGALPQEPGLFDRTMHRNIGMVRRNPTDEDIVTAAVQADADSFIRVLPEGYQTLIGDRGVKLSGGQKQRAAIARALLRKPKILVLDEPTSALDAISQQWVKETMAKLTASRQSTILLIAHRFSTIEMADLVVVLDNGRISDMGTHAELARRNGLYQRLRQLEGEGLLD